LKVFAGDWDGDGRRTFGLFILGDGAVFVYDSGSEVPNANPRGVPPTVAGGTDANVGDTNGDGDDEILIADPSGNIVIVDPNP
jgi:hypothetical protein